MGVASALQVANLKATLRQRCILSPIPANSMQRCKLHLLRPKIELKVPGCNNVAATLQLQPTIKTSMQPSCNVASCIVRNQKLSWKCQVATTLLHRCNCNRLLQPPCNDVASCTVCNQKLNRQYEVTTTLLKRCNYNQLLQPLCKVTATLQTAPYVTEYWVENLKLQQRCYYVAIATNY